MNPCGLNTIITAVANYLYATLSEKDFFALNIFLSELSKQMFSMELLRKVCEYDDKDHRDGKVKGKKQGTLPTTHKNKQ